MSEQQNQVTVRPLDRPGDLGWVVLAHGEIYAEQFGWDTSFERLVAGIVGDFAANDRPERSPGAQAGWIAEVDGERAGCIMCTPGDELATALLRVLLVTPKARGLGAG
ncbi:MAG: GNAT family N-acetyltransferase, partial [Nocardioidaceae bacterium]